MLVVTFAPCGKKSPVYFKNQQQDLTDERLKNDGSAKIHFVEFPVPGCLYPEQTFLI